ncbi:D-cysteine desulfhydrase family protein [Sphingosinicella rhizophila]|uniref:D-cysteine desulfhydrase family protein n=1 Tax=Sphingosinicella rhizophila TaxID=3050082 RepID=UPI0028E8EB1B|nr:D-cysteine desulfhydrase family protein [Sphingosinicella sp. GR2756]
MHGPTPFHPMARLAAELGLPSLYIKRDDCTGFALGGNKARKLEFTFADALAKGATAVITSGGSQSNHVRQTAAAATKLGLKCLAVLHSAFETTTDSYLRSGNRLLHDMFGAELHFVADAEEATSEKIEALRLGLEAAGERSYVVPLGASDGLGSLGYVVCANELVSDFASASIAPSHIFVGTGSAGTHGGLLAGLRLAGWEGQVIGISVSEPAEIKRGKVRDVIAQIGLTLGRSLPVKDEDIIVYDQYVGTDYGYPTPQSTAALIATARAEAVLLDPVYTAKVMAGMIDLLTRGKLGEVRDPVFLHTGGAPALFAYEGGSSLEIQ